MLVELHCHSTCSDGILTPAELAHEAHRSAVDVYCLTDHDTLAGHDHLGSTMAVGHNLRGLELSCRAFDRTIHLLIYDVRPGQDAALRRRLEGLQEARRHRIAEICRRLCELGIPLAIEDIEEAEPGGSIGRPAVARALVRRKIVSSMREAFDRFLHDGGPADVPTERIGIPEGLRLATDCGAKVSLAHPHTLGHVALVEDLFRRHRANGLEGIEAYYGPYGRRERVPWLRLADQFDLVATGGSDFHGDIGSKGIRLGVTLPPRRASSLQRWLDL